MLAGSLSRRKGAGTQRSICLPSLFPLFQGDASEPSQAQGWGGRDKLPCWRGPLGLCGKVPIEGVYTVLSQAGTGHTQVSKTTDDTSIRQPASQSRTHTTTSQKRKPV